MTKQRHFTDQPGFTPDFKNVHRFLQRIYDPAPNSNWLWNRWQWMFSLPYLDESKLSQIGIWEDNGKIVGLATYEDNLGSAYLSLDKEYDQLKYALLEYSIKFLSAVDSSGKRKVKVSFGSLDRAFCSHAQELGFVKTGDVSSEARMTISQVSLAHPLPHGYSVIGLTEDNDFAKIDRVLWRGFGHEGKPPETGVEERRKSQLGPDFNKDLTVVVKAPNNEFVSYCGMWYDPITDYAIVEPVATDPEYRLKGLGRIAVCEGIRRCCQLGAKVVYVSSGQQFYYSFGFVPHSENNWWLYEEK